MEDLKEDGIVDENNTTNQQHYAFWPTAYKYGLIAALFGIILMLVFDLFGLNTPGSTSTLQTWIVSLVSFSVMAAFIILAIQYQRDQVQQGSIVLGRGFMTGFGVTLVSALILLFFYYIYYTFVQTGFQEALTQQVIISMEDSGMSDSEIQRAMGFASIFWSPPALAVFGAISIVVQGAIISLVAAAIMKRQA